MLEGFDFGVGMLLPFVGRDDDERGTLIQHDRPGLGRQRGLAARRGRRDLRRLPRLVRDALLRLLPRALPHPRRADRPRRRDRVPQQADRTRGGAARWDAVLAVSSALPALLWGVAFADIVHGVPIDAQGNFTGQPARPARALRAARRRDVARPLRLPRRALPRAADDGGPAASARAERRFGSRCRRGAARARVPRLDVRRTPCERTREGASFRASSRSRRSCLPFAAGALVRAGRTGIRLRGDGALDRC